MFIRAVGGKFREGEAFDARKVRDSAHRDAILHRTRDALLAEICSGLSDKGLLAREEGSEWAFSATAFGMACFEEIMRSVAGRARCAGGRSYSGED